MISSEQTRGGSGDDREGVLVTELTYNDVLMGRGAPAIDNEGNVRMRKLIAKRKARYMGVSKRQEKDQIAREVVRIIRSQGGRFLKKLEDAELCRRMGVAEGTDAWVTVEEEAVLTKVKQALRDKSTEDDDPRPRRRKRVKRGNLVPEDDSETGSAEQKMGSVAEASREQQVPEMRNILPPPNATAAASALGGSAASGTLGNVAMGRDASGPAGTPEAQIAALLQQFRPAEGHNDGISFRNMGLLPALPAATSQLLSTFPNDALRGGRLGNLSAGPALPANLLSFSSPQHLAGFDPLLGSVSRQGQPSQELRGLAGSNEVLMGLLGRDLLLRQGLPAAKNTKPAACEDIVHEAILTHRFASSSQVKAASSLTVSLFEASLLLALCDFGLPLLPTGSTVSAVAASATPTANKPWSWEALAEKILERNIQTGDNRSSFIALANLCNADVESIQRTTLLVASLARNPQELARVALMFLARIDSVSSSSSSTTTTASQGIESLARAASAGGGGAAGAASTLLATTGSASGGALSSLGTDRDRDSRVEDDFTGAGDLVSVSRIFLNQWAMHLGVVTKGGQVVGFSSGDIGEQADKCFRCIASLDGRNCGRLFAIVGVLTQLRSILTQHERQNVIDALSLFPGRIKPLGTSVAWWVTADVAVRDAWLIESSVELGVIGALDADASVVGAPTGTLRQSSVSSLDVETRLEQLGRFLVSHFESVSRARIVEERAAALTALLR